MPRFFFDVDDGDRSFPDEEGAELAHHDASREAIALLAEIARAMLTLSERGDLTARVRSDEGPAFEVKLSFSVVRTRA